jgi:hypothetical protein
VRLEARRAPAIPGEKRALFRGVRFVPRNALAISFQAAKRAGDSVSSLETKSKMRFAGITTHPPEDQLILKVE